MIDFSQISLNFMESLLIALLFLPFFIVQEFFLLLIEEIFDQKYGMFKEIEDTQNIWFNSQVDYLLAPMEFRLELVFSYVPSAILFDHSGIYR